MLSTVPPSPAGPQTESAADVYPAVPERTTVAIMCRGTGRLAPEAPSVCGVDQPDTSAASCGLGPGSSEPTGWRRPGRRAAPRSQASPWRSPSREGCSSRLSEHLHRQRTANRPSGDRSVKMCGCQTAHTAADQCLRLASSQRRRQSSSVMRSGSHRWPGLSSSSPRSMA
jgi:hypothetical protein